eukprot:scaffold66122_cov69-Phaeocystis_antarctica.AAC.5
MVSHTTRLVCYAILSICRKHTAKGRPGYHPPHEVSSNPRLDMRSRRAVRAPGVRRTTVATTAKSRNYHPLGAHDRCLAAPQGASINSEKALV